MKVKPLRKFLKEEGMLETVEYKVFEIGMKYCPSVDLWAYLKQVIVKPTRATTRLGTAHYTKKQISITVLDISPEKRRDTILHELAHLVAFHIFGHKIKPHGSEWRSIAVMFGARPRASSDDFRFKAAANELRRSREKIVARCSKCDFELMRTRITEKYHNRVYLHRGCGGAFEPPDLPGYWKGVME